MPSAFSIPKVYEQEIEAVIDAGYYSNKSEVVRDALRNLFDSKNELKIAAAVEMYKKEEITLSKAAEIAGMNILQFKDILIDRGIKIKSPQETKEDLKRGVRLLRQIKASA